MSSSVYAKHLCDDFDRMLTSSRRAGNKILDLNTLCLTPNFVQHVSFSLPHITKAIPIFTSFQQESPLSRHFMMTTPPQVRVGVGVFVLSTSSGSTTNPRFLIGKRINSHGSGTYALPGGHLEFGETTEECAAREVMEETGLKVSGVRFLTATNDYMPTVNKHYITLFTVCVRDNSSDEPQVLEPDKCEGWEWATWEELLEWEKIHSEAGDGMVVEKKLFMPLLNLLRQRSGVIPTLT